MSYYDHATLMALRLGPWDPRAGEGDRRFGHRPAGSRLRQLFLFLAGNSRLERKSGAGRQLRKKEFIKP